jgi:hypothetical protein
MKMQVGRFEKNNKKRGINVGQWVRVSRVNRRETPLGYKAGDNVQSLRRRFNQTGILRSECFAISASKPRRSQAKSPISESHVVNKKHHEDPGAGAAGAP